MATEDTEEIVTLYLNYNMQLEMGTNLKLLNKLFHNLLLNDKVYLKGKCINHVDSQLSTMV